jgi:hypothetical protein
MLAFDAAPLGQPRNLTKTAIELRNVVQGQALLATNRQIRLGLRLVQAGSASTKLGNPAESLCPCQGKACSAKSLAAQPATSRRGEIKFNNIIKRIPKKWKFGKSTYCSQNPACFALASARSQFPQLEQKLRQSF